MQSKIFHGFTLIELLIVIAILGILSTMGVGNFTTSRIKARDLARKSDLATIAKSLEAYVNDHRGYPLSDTNGKIVCLADGTICNWGSPFVDDQGTIYVAKLPDTSNGNYSYKSDGKTYTLYARLDNVNDPAIQTITPAVSCGALSCNYKISSTNQ
jgi:general secretion pathway protein G